MSPSPIASLPLNDCLGVCALSISCCPYHDTARCAIIVSFQLSYRDSHMFFKFRVIFFKFLHAYLHLSDQPPTCRSPQPFTHNINYAIRVQTAAITPARYFMQDNPGHQHHRGSIPRLPVLFRETRTLLPERHQCSQRQHRTRPSEEQS